MGTVIGVRQRPENMQEADSRERLTFLRKTYSCVFLGVVMFAATIMAVDQVAAFQSMAKGLLEMSPLISLLLLIGVGFGVRACARVPGVGFVVYLAYTVFMGLLIAPWALHASDTCLLPAAVMTVAVFTGLTAYVFITKSDFSFLGGILSIGLAALVGIAIVCLLTGFNPGVAFSIFGALLFAGYILDDTSEVMNRCGPGDEVPAAIELFTDVILLFWHILQIFMRNE